MNIVILGWGSLIWDSRDLPRESEWRQHGPKLPIEFSRISADGRLTLVIDHENGVKVPTRYAVSPRASISDARNDLQEREGTASNKQIGFVNCIHGRNIANEYSEHKQDVDQNRLSDHKDTCKAITAWLMKSGYDGAVWTALNSNFAEQLRGIPFSVNSAVKYVTDLPTNVRNQAFKYILCAPPEVKTPFRKALQRHMEFAKYVKKHQAC